MKNTKKCPKCYSEDIHLIESNNILLSRYGSYIRIGYTIFSEVPVTRYVCCTCGYSEEWIDQEYLPSISQKYPRLYKIDSD
jgi:Zn ribbon nucleic-acid-binding protein